MIFWWVEYIPEHIPVVISIRFRVDFLNFERSSVSSQRGNIADISSFKIVIFSRDPTAIR